MAWFLVLCSWLGRLTLFGVRFMGKHTNGPWASKGHDGKYFSKHGWSVDHDREGSWISVPVHRGGYVVALVVDADGDDEQLEANAALIAAAPDLLEAIQGVRSFIEMFHGDLTKIDAAIAKATGDS